MKKIFSMMVATVLSLCAFYSTCWYAPSPGFAALLPLLVVGLFTYMVLVYVLYRTCSRRVSKKEVAS